MRWAFALALLLGPALALAQQAPPGIQSMNDRIGAQIGALVIQNAQLSLQVEMLQKQLAEAQAKLAEQKPAPPQQ